ncbi:MAG: cysteine hydrolase [Chloroflexi bacterium]|nr:cysteine hydrolase [Chloroflexota bacterium]
MDLRAIADRAHTAIVVIDVQNDFCHPEGGQARMGMDVTAGQKMVNTLLEFLDRSRQVKVPTVFVRNTQNAWTRSPAQLAKRANRPLICEEGSWGAEFYRVAPAEGDYVVTKHRYSAFVGTDLDLVLRCRGIKTLALCGVTTNTCVESTARDGFMLEYNIIMLSDCVATHRPEEHKAALDNIRDRFGYVLTSGDILELWKS